MESIVARDDLSVMGIRCADRIEEIQQIWPRLEEIVGPLHGRRFFGAMYTEPREYRACVRVEPDDDPAALGLEPFTLSGGRYVRLTLKGEPPGVYGQIGRSFMQLVEAHPDWDQSRPGIEYYRRRNEIDLLLPIA
jgi:hypothetical protein